MADAVIAPTVVAQATGVPGVLVTWSALDSDDSGAPVTLIDYPDRTVVISGTFGAGGSCTLQGSNDASTYHTLTDPQGNAITKTAAGMEAVTEAPVWIRPKVTAGDGTTAIDVSLLCMRTVR